MTSARIIPTSVTSTPTAIIQTHHTFAFVRLATQATEKLAPELVRTLPKFGKYQVNAVVLFAYADWLLEGD